MGTMQERITSTKTGSITSVQAVYVPADDLTDPAPATTFTHLDATTVLDRKIAELGIYPAVDPLGSTSRILDPLVVGKDHYECAQRVKEILQRYKERFLKQPEMTANEVAVRFLSRNFKMKPMAVDERINKHIEKYGEFAGEGFLVPDGFCFKLSGKEYMDGKASVGISFFTTFMPLSEMSKSQQQAIFEECMKDIDDLSDSVL